jgi:peroxin-7
MHKLSSNIFASTSSTFDNHHFIPDISYSCWLPSLCSLPRLSSSGSQTSIHYAYNVGVSDQRLQRLLGQVFTLLRQSNSCCHGRKLWISWQWETLHSEFDGKRNRSREVVSAIIVSSSTPLVASVEYISLSKQETYGNPRFDTKDALFDIAWSESHENQIITGCGDGSVKLFDITLSQFPIASWSEHGREVFSVHWNLLTKETFASSSWDGTIKIWNPNVPQSITTLPTHSCTYSVEYSPHNPFLLSCVTSDSTVRFFDLRTPSSASNHQVMAFPNNVSALSEQGLKPVVTPPAEVLTHDWNKYRDTIVATAGVDKMIRTFDMRNSNGTPVAVLPGHEYAIRRITWSPHLSDVLLSASYDMTCRVWTDGSAMGSGNVPQPDMSGHNPMVLGGGRELGRMGRHTEFATGVDWCLFGSEGWCTSCAWDERVLVWDVRAIMGA